MKKFKYHAINIKGEDVDGTIDAESTKAAIVQIRSLDLYPLQIVEFGSTFEPIYKDLTQRKTLKIKSTIVFFLMGMIVGFLPYLIVKIIQFLNS